MSLRLLPALVLLLATGPAPAQQQPAGPPPSTQRPVPALRPEDRAAYLDARVAAVHAGLGLTAAQDALWPALENAVREGLAQSLLLHDRAIAAGQAADPVERLSRIAEASIARGQVLRRIVEAARPLYASLTEEQKARIPILLSGGARLGDLSFGLLPRSLFPARSGPLSPPPGNPSAAPRPADGQGPDRFGPPPGGDRD